MQDPVRRVAYVSFARGCGFGGLTIFTTMLGMSYQPVLALRIGGYGWLLVTTILLLMVHLAPRTSYRSTEIWLMLPTELRPPREVAQQRIAEVRIDVMQRFAYATAWLAAVLLAGALFLELLGR